MRHKNKAAYNIVKHSQSELNNKLKIVRNFVKGNNFKRASLILKDLEEEFSYDKYYILECGIYYFELAQFEENSNVLFSKSLEYFEDLTTCSLKYRAYYYMGKINLINKNYDMAYYYFNLIEKNDCKEKKFAKLELSKLYKYQNEYEKALETLYSIDEYVNLPNSFYVSYKLEIADNYISLKNYLGATQIIDSILNNKNYKIFFDKAYYLKASIEYEQTNYETCNKFLSKIKKLNNKDLLLKANVQYKLGNINEAYRICNTIDDNLLVENDKKILLAKIKIKCNEFESASQILKNLIESNQENINLNYYLGIINFRKDNINEARKNFNICIDNNLSNSNISELQLIFIDIKQNNINEAYSKFKKLTELNFFTNNNFYIGNLLSAYLSSYYNIDFKLDSHAYSIKQILNYSEEEVKNHVLEHTIKKGPNHSLYNENIDIDKLIQYVKDNLNENTYNGNNFFDEYIIEYKNVGVSNGVVQNYIRVITIPNTDKIITVYPFSEYKIETEDKIYPEYSTKKYVKVSQIEKFCNRYGYHYEK